MRAVYFSDFTHPIEMEQRWLQKIKALTGADELLAVMSGDFLQNGLPAGETRKLRAQKGLQAGAGSVIEMSVYASLSSIGIYAYSAARMLDKLKCIDVLVLETEAPTELLDKIVYLSIANTREFQQKVTAYKTSGMPFYVASAKAIGEVIPGGEEVMLKWSNIFAVECIKALKMMYSSIQCVCVPAEGMVCLADEPKRKLNPMIDELIRYQCYVYEARLSDIYGGYEELSERIVAQREHFTTFRDFAEIVAGTDKDIHDVRKYLLRLLCGLKKSKITVWRMYDFSPYCSMYTVSEDIFNRFKAVSGVLLIKPDEDVWLHEQSKRDLLAIEYRTANIYKLLS